MEALMEDSLDLEISRSPGSFLKLLESQRELFHSQIDQFQNVVAAQCKLTGVNPLSQEMAADALSIKIGKRPRDLLNPKAVKYMQSVFAIKDAISKKESREISARFGVKVTQVRDFFASQRTRVRKFIRLSRENSIRSVAPRDACVEDPTNSESNVPVDPVPLSAVGPSSNTEEAPSCSSQNNALSDVDELDKDFVINIFNLMGKEETFSGQVKLMKWILQIQNVKVLSWFLNKGGVMIIATWLSQAATEEQTSVLFVILEVLSHLPIHDAVPAHVSAILQSVNMLRFYRASDVSNRAKSLLAKWSKIFARSQALKRPNGIKTSEAALKERVWNQSLSEIMGNGMWQSNANISEGMLAPYEGLENMRKLESSQPLKLLTSSPDDSNRKQILGVSHTKERRKVQFVEQPGRKMPSRVPQASKATPALANRPITVDDIKKAKLRASFMQSKYGKREPSSIGKKEIENENPMKPSIVDISSLPTVPKAEVDPKSEEEKITIISSTSISNNPDSLKPKLDLRQPRLEECKRSEIPWQSPPEVILNDAWRIGSGEDSKEVEVQRNRNRRDKETVYKIAQEIPSNPKEPWDREMDYDDSLTPMIPIEQLSDAEAMEPSEEQTNRSLPSSNATLASSSSSSLVVSQGALAEPDLELLAVLLRNPELVIALTTGQAGNLSNQDTVRLLDMIKSDGAGNSNGSGGGVGGGRNAEVSLPSPTPSSDPGTNPFSQQRQIGNGAMAQNPAVADPNVVLHQQLTNLQQLLQLQQLQHHPAAVPPVPVLQTASTVTSVYRPSLQQTAEAARVTITSPAFPNVSPGPESLYGARAQPHHLYAEPVVQKHSYHSGSLIGQPISGSNSWRDGPGYHQHAHQYANHQTTNFNTSYDGQLGFGSHGAGGAGRYPEYVQGRNLPEPASNAGSGYRPERSAQRDSPAYWDPSRHGERWQRDRRY